MVRSERGVGDAREKKSPSRSRHGATPQQLKLSRSSVFRLRIFFLASLSSLDLYGLARLRSQKIRVSSTIHLAVAAAALFFELHFSPPLIHTLIPNSTRVCRSAQLRLLSLLYLSFCLFSSCFGNSRLSLPPLLWSQY